MYHEDVDDRASKKLISEDTDQKEDFACKLSTLFVRLWNYKRIH